MIDWRSAVTWVPSLSNGVRDVRRSFRFPLQLPAGLVHPASASSGGAVVPWTWADVGYALLWGLGLAVGGAVGLLVFRLMLALAFALCEAVGLLHAGALDGLAGAVGPYSRATTLLLLGGMLYCAVLYGVYRSSIRRYTISWSSLYFRHAGWRTYGRVAVLFVPIVCGGLIVTRLQTTLLGGSLDNPQADLLTHGMPPLPLNFLFLFLLLAVVTPIAEETFFRAFLYRLLRKRLPVWAAASASAAAYAALHGVPVLMPWLFFMGIAFALVVEKTQSIYSSMILHGMANALATLSIIAVLSGW